MNQLANDLESMQLGSQGITEGPHLLFKPTEDEQAVTYIFSYVPRYLFRISSPDSHCTTNNTWVMSKDATNGKPSATTDCFDRVDKDQVASELNYHLRWWRTNDDNFVSWTSSLLFVLQYIYHLAASVENSLSTLENIELCIIGTNGFTPGVFIQDLDLLKVYGWYDQSSDPNDRTLMSLQTLRHKKHKSFGEYLSQGSLKVEGCIGIVTAAQLVEAGLPLLHLPTEHNEWANEVCRMREDFYNRKTSHLSEDQELAVLAIMQLFEPQWRLPIAANLMALQPRPENDDRVLLILTEALSGKFLLRNFEFLFLTYVGEDKKEWSRYDMKMIASDTLPEVKEVEKFFDLLHQYQQLVRLESKISSQNNGHERF